MNSDADRRSRFGPIEMGPNQQEGKVGRQLRRELLKGTLKGTLKGIPSLRLMPPTPALAVALAVALAPSL